MIPNVDEEQMQRELTLKHLGGIKPEAPWIKRCGFGIKFTDEIQDADFKLEPDSAKNEDYSHEENHRKADKYEAPVYQKKALSEQIIRKNDYTIDEHFINKENAYYPREYEHEIDGNKVSIIEDSKIDAD